MKEDRIHALAVTWTSGINHYARKDGIELQKMILGMEILLHNIPKLALVLIVANFFNILPQTLATWFPFYCIRRYAGGLHASNSINCTSMTLFLFVAVPYALQGIHINVAILLLTFLAIGFGLYKYAPADTAAKPIIGIKKRTKLKWKAVVAGGFVLLFALTLKEEAYYGLFVLGSIYAVVVVLPITYRILGRSMKNYERYE